MSSLREKVAKAIHTATYADSDDCYFAADAVEAIYAEDRRELVEALEKAKRQCANHDHDGAWGTIDSALAKVDGCGPVEEE